MTGSAKLLGATAGIGIGAYLVAVTYNGNLNAFGSSLLKESGYLEFVVALFVLGAINQYGPTSKISLAVTGIGITAVILKAASNTAITGKISEFANGQASMLDVFKAIVAGD